MATLEVVGREIVEVEAKIGDVEREIHDLKQKTSTLEKSNAENPLLFALAQQLPGLQQQLAGLQQQLAELRRKKNILLERGPASSPQLLFTPESYQQLLLWLQRGFPTNEVHVSATDCSSERWQRELMTRIEQLYNLHIATSNNFSAQLPVPLDVESMSHIKGLLTQVAAAAGLGQPGDGGDASGLLHSERDMDMRQAAAGQVGPGFGASTSLQMAPDGHGSCMAGHQHGNGPGGGVHVQTGSTVQDCCDSGSAAHEASGTIDYEGDSDSGSPDEAAEEAYALNLHAQQMMSILKEPSMYKSLGLAAAPTWYSPPSLEDLFRGCTFLDPSTGLPFGQQKKKQEDSMSLPGGQCFQP